MTSKRRKRTDVQACPACGSASLDSSYGPADPVMAGTNLGLLTCGQCGRCVVPIRFSSEAQRARFEKTQSNSSHAALRSDAADPTPGVGLARMDAVVSLVFSVLMGAGLFFMGQPIAGGVLLLVGLLFSLFFLRR